MNSPLLADVRIKINRAEPVHVQIEKELLNLIKSGRINPGDRIPSAEALAASLTVHPTTVQKALRRLGTSGLIVRTPRLGTFVKSKQERITVALAFGPSLTDESAHFYRALLRTLREAMAEPGWHCRVYDGLNASLGSSKRKRSPVLMHMAADRKIERFSGSIVIALGRKGAPDIQVACGTPLTVTYGVGEDVQPDFHDFTSRSVSFLAGQGRKRIVYLRTLPERSDTNADIHGLQDAAQRQGLPAIDVIQLPMRPVHYDEGPDRVFCQGLTRQWNATGIWPDGMIMSDDITMRGLAHALISCGPQRVNRMSVVSWANEGINFHYGMPVTRYVVSPSETARRLTAQFQKRMMGRAQGVAGIPVRGRICPDKSGEWKKSLTA